MALSVSEAVADGDTRKILDAIIADLAAKLDLAEPAVAAQIAGQLRQAIKDRDALPAPKGVSKRDDLKDRRARRQSGAAPEPAAAKGGRQRG